MNTQVDKDKATNTAIESLELSYNEVHAMELGGLTAFLIALISTKTPTLSLLLAVDKGLSATGYSFTTDAVDMKPTNYAFSYTVRAEPWYFLGVYIPTFTITYYLLQKHSKQK